MCVTFINKLLILSNITISILVDFVFLEGKMDSSRPIDALNNAKNKKVIIELKNNRQYVGILRALDMHINCVLENAEERVDGEVKRKIGIMFLRGDMITVVMPTD